MRRYGSHAFISSRIDVIQSNPRIDRVNPSKRYIHNNMSTRRRLLLLALALIGGVDSFRLFNIDGRER